MFVRDEVMLHVGFDEARDRLAKLDRWFPAASDDIYREEIAVLDADLTLAPAGENAALLTLAGAYRPPLGNRGAELDRLLLDRVADATIRHFLDRVAAALGRRSRGSGPLCS